MYRTLANLSATFMVVVVIFFFMSAFMGAIDQQLDTSLGCVVSNLNPCGGTK
jgi:hypothetical protein